MVAVGTRLQLKYSRSLPDREVHVITPGIFEKFTGLSEQKVGKVTNDQYEFHIFVFGRGTFEDLSLKGYDVIADAVGSLGEKFKMTFVGSPEGQHRKIEDWLLRATRITRDQVTIRGYCDQEELKTMFLEADLVALPSRTEGFGLVALEAISAGVPVLVTSKSGIAKALEKVEGGHLVVVKSGNREEWLQKITQLSMQNPEERCDGAVRLREEYRKIYSWDTQCAKFKKIVQDLTDRPASAVAVGSNGRQCERMFLEFNYSTVTTAVFTKFTIGLQDCRYHFKLLGKCNQQAGNCLAWKFSHQFRFLKAVPTYPSPESTLTLTSHLLQNVGLGEK